MRLTGDPHQSPNREQTHSGRHELGETAFPLASQRRAAADSLEEKSETSGPRDSDPPGATHSMESNSGGSRNGSETTQSALSDINEHHWEADSEAMADRLSSPSDLSPAYAHPAKGVHGIALERQWEEPLEPEFIMLPICGYCGGVPDIATIVPGDIGFQPSNYVNSVLLHRDSIHRFIYQLRGKCSSCSRTADLVPYHVAWPQRRSMCVEEDTTRKECQYHWISTALVRDFLDLSIGALNTSVHGFV